MFGLKPAPDAHESTKHPLAILQIFNDDRLYNSLHFSPSASADGMKLPKAPFRSLVTAKDFLIAQHTLARY